MVAPQEVLRKSEFPALSPSQQGDQQHAHASEVRKGLAHCMSKESLHDTQSTQNLHPPGCDLVLKNDMGHPISQMETLR